MKNGAAWRFCAHKRKDSSESPGFDQQREQARLCKAYYARKYYGGRNPFARTLDYIVLRGIAFICAYLFFLPRFPKQSTALLLSGIALGILMLLLRMGRQISFERFMKNETARIRRVLLTDTLLLADLPDLIALVSGRCPLGETPIVLAQAQNTTADSLLKALQTHKGCGHLHIFACVGYDRSAREFAGRMWEHMTLHEPEEILRSARLAGMEPDSGQVSEWIAQQQRNLRKKRQSIRIKASPFAAGGAKKYVMTGLILMGLSFFTRYTLYYRMLAGLCMSIAACSTMFLRTGTHVSQ